MLKKINVLHIFTLALIIILISGFLPATTAWSQPLLSPGNPSNNYLKTLENYQHPKIPIVSSAALPQLSATSYIVVDCVSNTIVVSKNPDSRIYPASTTKLATALTALNSYSLDEVVTVNVPYKEGKIMDLKAGEKLTFHSLLSALLIDSANDSAHALADHYPGGEVAFVNAMNELVRKYQLNHTHFVNVDGIHDNNHYSTVYDLSQLGRLAIKNPIVREIVRTPKLTVTDVSNLIQHPIVTTNELLGVVPEVEGLKTGWTPEASGSFIGLLNINGHQLISVVAASDDRFGDTKTIIDWLKTNLSYQDYNPELIMESATAGK